MPTINYGTLVWQTASVRKMVAGWASVTLWHRGLINAALDALDGALKPLARLAYSVQVTPTRIREIFSLVATLSQRVHQAGVVETRDRVRALTVLSKMKKTLMANIQLDFFVA